MRVGSHTPSQQEGGTGDEKKYKKIAGCLFLLNNRKIPIYDSPLCPICKERMESNADKYICPHCRYETDFAQTNDAVRRDKARLGLK